jgi:uncharacterized DUF497 family protein
LTFKSIPSIIHHRDERAVGGDGLVWQKPDDIDWDEDNTRHVEAAELTPEEVESVLDDPDGDVEPSEGAPDGTVRWIVFGTTDTGKHIAVVFEINVRRPVLRAPRVRLRDARIRRRGLTAGWT